MRLPLLPLALLFFAAPLAAQPCDPAATSEVCPDTTDWRSYFPLEVGNAWQYECQGFCHDEYDRATGRRVVDAEEVDGEMLYSIQRCRQRGTGEITCWLAEGVRYDEDARLVVAEGNGGEPYDYLLACDLGMPFNVEVEYECGIESFLDQWFSFGSYGATLPLPGSEVNGTFKSIGNIGGGAEYLAGVGPTRFAGDATPVDYPIAYARVGDTEYGKPVFAFPTDTEGLTPPRLALDLNVFPNPARDALTVRLSLPESQAVTLDVFDALGRRVLVQEAGPRAAGEAVVTVAVGALPAGAYTVRLRGSEVSARVAVMR